MTYTQPWRRLCNCRCALHHGNLRTNYTDPMCGCALTCATQPMTLLVEQWNYAMFRHPSGELWGVPAIGTGSWDWSHAGMIDPRHDYYDANVVIDYLLRLAADIVNHTIR